MIEYRNALGILADICQILSIPLAVWLALGPQKKSFKRIITAVAELISNEPRSFLENILGKCFSCSVFSKKQRGKDESSVRAIIKKKGGINRSYDYPDISPWPRVC